MVNSDSKRNFYEVTKISAFILTGVTLEEWKEYLGPEEDE